MIKREILLICLTALFVILFILPCSNAIGGTECVTVEVSDISPSSIEIGKEFTIGVQIENCGETLPEFVSFELLNPPKEVTIKEPLIINISKLYYGNSERFLTYHLRTNEDASPGTYVIKTKLSYGKTGRSITKYYDIAFDIIGNKAEIGIASVKSNPVLPIKGDTVELTLRIENSGKGTAKSIKVFVDHPFQGVKQSFLGTLKSDEDGPAIFTFMTKDSGEFEFPVIISYYDDFGEKEVRTNVSLTILEKESNLTLIIASVIIVILAGTGVVYFFKVKKAKDKIIQQLLKGNVINEKNKK